MPISLCGLRFGTIFKKNSHLKIKFKLFKTGVVLPNVSTASKHFINNSRSQYEYDNILIYLYYKIYKKIPCKSDVCSLCHTLMT